MTTEQFDRWKAFALALAQGGWETMTPARRKKLTEEITNFFDWLNAEDWKHFVSWDHSERHPQDDGTFGSRHFSYTIACDHFSDSFDQYVPARYENNFYDHCRFYDQLACCIRAGMDMAAEPSMGVLGFTKSDVVRMFSGNVPEWVSADFENWDVIPLSAGLWL